MSMMDEIHQQWVQWDLYDANGEGDGSSPLLPYYVVPTRDLLNFLYAQINKYCFLFEHILAHTAKTYSLPKTMVMVVALRALRFCYGSSLVQRESLLYRDRWEVRRGQTIVVKEGLGMHDSMERCGLGWFLPKFNWAAWRLAEPHGENVLVGNALMHEEYKRRWRAVRDLRDVFIRFNQAESWYKKYDMQSNRGLEKAWLEYLILLNIEQFDANVWSALLKANKRSHELQPSAGQWAADAMQFCYCDMKRLFIANGAACGPHLVTGNKMRFEKVMDVMHFLFLQDEQERPGWGDKPYRVILQKTLDMLEQRLGCRRADRWLGRFLHVVRLTHWLLPYPSNGALITSTKTSHRQGLTRRTMWFSTMYTNPEFVEAPLRRPLSTMASLVWQAGRRTFGVGREQEAFRTAQLLAALQAQGVEECGQEEYWVAGKASVGLKGFVGLWERGRPPRLKMLEDMRKRTLDELESLMAGLSREESASLGLGGRVGSGEGDDNAEAHTDPRRPAAIVAGRNVMAAFAKGSPLSDWYEADIRRRSRSSTIVSSHSSFMPSEGSK